MSQTAAPVAGTLESLTGTYTLDPAHSRLGFSARHAMVATVRGLFGDVTGTIHLDGTDPSRSSAEVTIQAASIDTGNPDRDTHLRSADFLDVERFPNLTFRSTAAEQVDGDTYRLTGELTIRDVTQPVALDVVFEGTATDPFGNVRAGFSGTGAISRKAFGATWNLALEAGGVMVSDKVKLTLDVSAIRA